MPVAKLDTETIFKDLNQLRRGGELLTNQDEITRLERSIEALKAGKNGQSASMEEVARYYVTLASLRCLTGDFEEVLVLGEKAVRLTNDTRVIANHVVSLAVAGYFSKARALFDTLHDYELVDFDNKQNIAKLIIDCQSYGIEGSIVDSLREIFPSEIKSIHEAHQILSELNITEQQVLDMMDLAGEMMRNKNVFLTQDAKLSTYPNDKFMTINLPVNLPPDEVAKLEWEYLGEAIKNFPDVPFSSVSIGFSCNH